MLLRSVALFVYLGLFAGSAASFPALTYSTYLRDNFTANAVAVDSAGNVYLAGNVIADAATSQTTILVVKLNPQGTAYLYIRFLGGSVNDYANAIAVDSAGNAYVAGVTNSPDFPVTNGSTLGTPPVIPSERSFVTKLDAKGEIVFSTLLGGSTNSYAQAVAVNSSGQVVVSGTSVDQGFPSTLGVYSVANTAFVPYLIELDPTGTKLIFSATGIGGSAVAFDVSGNIYMAGTTGSLTYPTTAGSYQPNFPMFQTCLPPCTGHFQGYNQYVTKLDPTGTKMIFSTAVSGNGNTMNEGLAVDSAGNVYLTGLAGTGYPYTVATPTPPSGPAAIALATPALPFLTKLDPAGQKLVYSVPVGGLGVAVDASGNAYTGGVLGVLYPYDVAAMLPVLTSVPSQCVSAGGTYAAEVDAAGNTVGSQFIGGSIRLSGVALSGSALWMAGKAGASIAFSPGALASPNLIPTSPQGAYLGAVNFAASQPPTGTPQISCVLDAGDFALAGPIVPFQLLTILGNGLGPAPPVSATDNSTTSLGGVGVKFGSLQAPLLYVSSNQINVAVPMVQLEPATTVMQVSVNGVPSAQVQYAVTPANPSLFVVPGTFQSNLQLFTSVALNADGSMNSSSNPAQLGSVVTVFVNGLTPDPQNLFGPAQLSTGGGWSIVNVSQATPFVTQLELRVPSANMNFECGLPKTSACIATFGIQDSTPYLLPGSIPLTARGPSFSGALWVALN
jgi:uncharacterized protein (TIGR03437 family)